MISVDSDGISKVLRLAPGRSKPGQAHSEHTHKKPRTASVESKDAEKERKEKEEKEREEHTVSKQERAKLALVARLDVSRIGVLVFSARSKTDVCTHSRFPGFIALFSAAVGASFLLVARRLRTVRRPRQCTFLCSVIGCNLYWLLLIYRAVCLCAKRSDPLCSLSCKFAALKWTIWPRSASFPLSSSSRRVCCFALALVCCVLCHNFLCC